MPGPHRIRPRRRLSSRRPFRKRRRSRANAARLLAADEKENLGCRNWTNPNLQSEIWNWTVSAADQSDISDFGFEVRIRPISKSQIPLVLYLMSLALSVMLSS